MTSLVHMFLLCNIISFVQCEENDIANTEARKPFRLKKYNAIWKRVESEVPDYKLTNIESVLRKLDREELSLKHQKGEEKDYSKDLEKSIQDQLCLVLKEHNLLNKRQIQDLNLVFYDEKLQNIWNAAVHKADLAVTELIELKDELDITYETLKKLSKAKEETPRGHHVHQEIIKRFNRVHYDLGQMREKIHRRSGDNSHLFTDTRVIDIWKKAISKPDASPEKLNDLKLELEVLQRHIDKLEHWENVKRDMEDNKEVDKNQEWKDHYHSVKRSIQTNKKFIKKLHMTMHETLRDEL